jgi:hypothetical protein
MDNASNDLNSVSQNQQKVNKLQNSFKPITAMKVKVEIPEITRPELNLNLNPIKSVENGFANEFNDINTEVESETDLNNDASDSIQNGSKKFRGKYKRKKTRNAKIRRHRNPAGYNSIKMANFLMCANW